MHIKSIIAAALAVLYPCASFAQVSTTGVGTQAASAFRDFETPGDPLSGVHNPRKSEIRDLFTMADAQFALNNTALSALSTAQIGRAWRVGFATWGDSPEVLYTPSNSACSLNAGAGDGGSQVPSADGKCWIAQFTGQADLRAWGASPSAVELVNDTAIDNAFAWACANQRKVVVPYPGATTPYLIKAPHQLGNGSSSAFSTCNNAGFEELNPVNEPSSGTTPPISLAFRWTGSAGVIPFNVQGPAGSLKIIGVGVDCNHICSTGIRVSNVMNGEAHDLAVVGNTNGPGIIFTTEQNNPWFGGFEGVEPYNIMVTVPAVGGSGVQLGDTGAACNRPIVDATLRNITVNFDALTPGTYGLKVGCVTQTTLINPRLTRDPVRSNPLFTGTLSPGSAVVTGIASVKVATVTTAGTTALSAGMVVTGPGMQPNTKIVSVDSSSQITLSLAATANAAQPLAAGFGYPITVAVPTTTVTGTLASGSPIVSGIASTTQLAAGLPVTGTGIPVGTTIASVAPTQITLSANATASGAQSLTSTNVSFPTDVKFIHPLADSPIDPGPANWAPVAGGFVFDGWSTVYTPFPTATAAGNYLGTDSQGDFGSLATFKNLMPLRFRNTAGVYGFGVGGSAIYKHSTNDQQYDNYDTGVHNFNGGTGLPPSGAVNTGSYRISGTTVIDGNARLAGTTNLPLVAADRVLLNATAGATTPQAYPMPSCSGAASALTYTFGTGFGCNTTLGGGWTTYSPTPTWNGGTAPTAFTLTGTWYQASAKTYKVRLDLTITTVGSATNPVKFSLPNSTTAKTVNACAGVDITAGGALSYAAVDTSTTIAMIAASLTSGHRYIINCEYEAN